MVFRDMTIRNFLFMDYESVLVSTKDYKFHNDL